MSSSRLNFASRLTPWLLFVLVIAIPLVGWLVSMGDAVSDLTPYQIFPLLGMWAWGIMWTHYAYGALFLSTARFERNTFYSHASGYVVLALILLHPGLLAFAQMTSRKLLPLASFYAYGDGSLKLFIVFGSAALLAFLMYEVLLNVRQRPLVARCWWLISLSQMAAMTLIFIHGLQLGQHLQNGWLQFYWISLGALLLPCFGIIGLADWRASRRTRQLSSRESSSSTEP